jgi:hypothetical protein
VKPIPQRADVSQTANARNAKFEFDEIQGILSKHLSEGWGNAVVRAEVGKGAGFIDLYLVARHGEVFHKASIPDLTSRLFDWVYSLPVLTTERSEEWNSFVANLVENQNTRIHFSSQGEQDVASFPARRQRFKYSNFPGKIVLYDPL